MEPHKWIVTSAWPYVNYEPHIGTLIHLLSADVFTRYLRVRGEDAVMVSGSDEHGTPIEVEAIKKGVNPKELTDANHQRILQILKEWEIQFDNYTRTESDVHKAFVRDFYSKVYKNGYVLKREVEMPYCEEKKMFLPDRFVVGTCPYCGYPEAHGDQCDNCGRLLEPKLLINPRGVFCDEPITWKTTSEWDFDLPAFSGELENYIKSNDRLPDNAKSMSLALIRDGLKPRSITRDNKWGIPAPFPGAEDKTIYVWMEAVLGYVSATKEFFEKKGEPERWKDYWFDKSSRFVCFIGKDNIPFHTIILPALLMATHDDYVLPWTVSSTEFILFGGEKSSKSKRKGIWSGDALSAFPADYWRFILMEMRPEGKDTSITIESAVSRVNSDLNDTLGNYLHRTLSFAYNNFGGRVPDPGELDQESLSVLEEAEKRSKAYSDAMYRTSLSSAVEDLMALARVGNRYVNERQPWKELKEGKANITTYVALQLAKDLAVMLYPLSPSAASSALSFMGLSPSWSAVESPLKAGSAISRSKPIFSKVELKKTEEKSVEPPLPPIDVEEFGKLDIRIGRVISAERVQGSKKLLRIKFDFGGFTKTTLGGLGVKYSPEELVGKKVAVLVNIKERDMMGEKSECMVLAAEGEDGSLGILVPMRDVPEGSRVHRMTETPRPARFDLHVHTVYSKDAVNRPEVITRMAKEKGLRGFAVTDHNTVDALGSFSGEHELVVVPGVEISTDLGHLLGLGIYECPKKGVALAEAVDFIHQRGGVAVAAHPFSGFKMGMGKALLKGLRVDGVEVFNASNWVPGSNSKARNGAFSALGKTGGSDAHFPWEVGNGFTYSVAGDPDNWEELLKLISSGSTDGSGRLSPLTKRLYWRVRQRLGWVSLRFGHKG